MGWKDKADDELKKPRKGGSYKLKEGENEIRVLPTKLKKKEKEPAIFSVYGIHTNVGPEKRVVTCGKNADGSGKCWLCDKQIPKDADSDSKSKRKRAETMKPKEVMALQVAYLDGKKLRGPELYTMNMGGKKSLAYKLLKTLANPRYDCEDLKKGRNILIDREGTGMATVYSAPTISDEKTEVPEKIVKSMKTFEELIPMYDQERQKTAYFGKDASDDSDASSAANSSDEEDKKKSSDADSDDDDSDVKKSSSDNDDSDDKKKSSDEEEDSEQDSSEAISDDEPKKGKKGKKGKKADSDEEEEDADSDDKGSDDSDVDSSDADSDDKNDDDEEEEEVSTKKGKGKGKGKGKKATKKAKKGKKGKK